MFFGRSTDLFTVQPDPHNQIKINFTRMASTMSSLPVSQDLKNPHEMDRWEKFLNTLQPNSRKQYENVILEFNEWMKSQKDQTLGEQTLLEFVKFKKFAPSTAEHNVSIIRSFWKMMHDFDLAWDNMQEMRQFLKSSKRAKPRQLWWPTAWNQAQKGRKERYQTLRWWGYKLSNFQIWNSARKLGSCHVWTYFW